jgi:single-stranded-DNA-specific exonuclease
MQGLTRRWRFRTGDGQDAAGRLPLFERLLASRGLTEADTVRRFCDPRLTDLGDPESIPGVTEAARRLAAAVRGGESIAIYGDYDVDGVAAAAILWHVIRAVAPEARVRTYVPHRLEEGYGLNEEALRQLRADGVSLVVSVDCGITARGPARIAREIGLDLIITDHHRPDAGADLPDADAIVHPALNGAHPCDCLCGAGVAFKLAWGFATHWCGSRRVGRSVQEVLLTMLPLAALGTIADVVPLVGENRTIASYGLKWLRRTPLAGLKALLEASGLMGEEVDTEKVGFILAPRLNACGRMGHAGDALRLLTDAVEPEAGTIARNLARLNRQRQLAEQQIAEQAAALAEDAGMTRPDRRAIVLAHETWHPGVVGVACSRLVDRFCRPVVLLQKQGDACRGSARSIEGYSIHDGLTAAAAHLTRFGGHHAAAGLALPTANLEAFIDALTAHANAHIPVESLVPGLCIDCDAGLPELNVEVVRRIKALSPFGRENPSPAIRVQGLVVSEAPKQIGANGRHLTVSLRSEDEGRRRWLRCVWFGAGDRASDLAAGMRLDAVVEPRINFWNGRSSVEALVQDLAVSGA